MDKLKIMYICIIYTQREKKGEQRQRQRQEYYLALNKRNYCHLPPYGRPEKIVC